MRYATTLLALAVPALLSAQLPQILPGTRVRVKAANETLTGTLMSQTPDTLDVAETGAIHHRIASANVREIRVSKGRSAKAGAAKGFKIGFFIGTIPAAVFSTLAIGEGALTYLALASLLTLEGGLWGALFGYLLGAEGWQRIY